MIGLNIFLDEADENIMDEKIKSVIEKKISETLEDLDTISKLNNSFENSSKSKIDFCTGIIIGRLYNSFHYQTRRILHRNPSDEEFSEFLIMIKKYEKNLQDLKF